MRAVNPGVCNEERRAEEQREIDAAILSLGEDMTSFSQDPPQPQEEYLNQISGGKYQAIC